MHAFVGIGGPYWTADDNGTVTVDPVSSEDAIGLVIEDFDFGLAIMQPTNKLDFVKYFALKATAESISLVGIDDVTVDANRLLVELNQSSPSLYGVPAFPVVDFANTDEFASEELALFGGNDMVISEAEARGYEFRRSTSVSLAAVLCERSREAACDSGYPRPHYGQEGRYDRS